MKKVKLLVIGFFFSLSIIAQGKSGDNKKGNDKSKTEKSAKEKKVKDKLEKDLKDEYEKKVKVEREEVAKEEHDKKVWDGTSDKRGKGPKFSKNQPAKVRAAFQQDYPNADNVSWSKYRGDWTATFGNGAFMSTALYHANGERRDTRTPIAQKELPVNVLDSIFKRRPGTRLEDIIKIEIPNTVKDIFRVKNYTLGEHGFSFYNKDGQPVQYDY